MSLWDWFDFGLFLAACLAALHLGGIYGLVGTAAALLLLKGDADRE